MKGNKNKNLLYLGIFLVLISLVGTIIFFELELIVAANYDPEYQRVLSELDKTDWVRVIVSVDTASARESIISSLSENEFRYLRRSEFEKMFVGEISKSGLDKLVNNINIKFVSMDVTLSPTLYQSVPLINATNVWAKGYSGKGQTVCVIDTGVNSTHPYLQGKVLAEKCYCSLHEGTSPYCCPNGSYEDNSARDNNGHGTHVSGIIVSQDSTYRGVAPNASVVVVKVCNSSLNNSCANSDVVNAITWCKNNKNNYNISVITMSLSFGIYAPATCPNWADDIINSAVSQGIFVDVASGNEGSTTGISYPACSPNATSVGASSKSDIIWSSTNRAGNLDLLAPGSAIWSLRWNPNGNHPYCTEVTDYIMVCDGTSQAAPHVAGAAALLKERDPTLTPDKIREILQDTGKNIYDSGGSNLTFKRIDIAAAVESLCTCTNWAAGSCGGGSCNPLKKLYTRTCTPSGCNPEGESKCEYDVSCETGGGSSLEITVCASGCNYTNIQTAINHSDANDKILVIDNRTYNEQIIMNSTTAGRLECQNGAIIKGSNTGTGIYLKKMDGFIIIGCKIDSFNYGIFSENSSHADIIDVVINNSYVIGLLLKDDSFDIRIKNISVLGTTGDNAVRFDGYGWSSNIVSYNKIEDSIIRKSGAAELVWINWGIYNDFLRSNFSESANGYEGILLNGHNNGGYHDIYDNNIFNNNIGIYFKDSKDNNINGNNFCPSNINNDFSISGLSTGNTGDDNRCEKPGSWNDAGTTGCTYYCDNPPIVTLLYPQNNFIDYDGNVDLVCQATDDYNLVNITLYHNISGIWLANQTQTISGTSNITTFNINNLPDGTFIWNCLVYDNKSRGSFALGNWSVQVSSIPNDTHKFYIKNGLNENVAWLGNLGNIVLKGKCFFNASCNNPGDNSFVVKNLTNNNVAFINSTGDLCIIKGDCSDQSASCNPARDAFIIRNTTNSNMSYIDFDGDLCLTGKLYQNSNP